ncbi:MAG: HAD-IC family P-type ATPase [Eubacterium sp.]|nr:HAD-IC family P-type ATPase [Eubacterium sp.]
MFGDDIMTGLTTAEAIKRAKEGYSNIQTDKSAKTAKDIVKENVFTYFNLIFLILAILLIIAGAFKELTFLPIVIANALIGIIQELHAKKVLDELSVLNEPTSIVIRDGEKRKISIEKLVLGDIVELSAGNQIPADGQVCAGEIYVNEALLTGESDEIVKRSGDSVMSGSFVVSGKCLIKLTKVGEEAYISKLTAKAKTLKGGERSEMIRAINRLVMIAGVLIVPIGIGLFYQSFNVQSLGFSESVTSMVAALIGMIPEGIYLLVSIALAISATRLAKKKIMLHDMKSTETLARVDVLCVDKTGTITDNSMLVAKVKPAEGYKAEEDKYKKLVGDYINSLPDNNTSMDALRAFFTEYAGRRAKDIFPFSSKYKYSSVCFDEGIYVLGAPEFVLRSSYEKYADIIEGYAKKGFRVMIFGKYAGQEVPKTGLSAEVEPIFYLCLQNPIRENAVNTFAYFRRQGVEVKVISGDNPLTVSEVAKEAKIPNADKYIDASRLRNDADIEEAAVKYTVFGRTTPEVKQKLVKALKKAGRTVAMTGDGVNDILAMKSADCSIAMAQGSDAAAQASQVVLLDSDFSHMPEIVAEGRRTINNIERSATLFLVKNIFSLLLSVFSIVNVLVYPLVPSQVSLVSLFNIGIPAFFLAVEPNNKRIEGHFLKRVLIKAMPAALTDFFAIAAMVVFGNTFGVSEEDISVASTFLLAIVGFMILWRISSPMNKYHMWVIGGCIVGIIVSALCFNDLFSISSVSTHCIMLFVVFAIATEPFMRYLSRLFEWIEDKGREYYKKSEAV